MRTTDLNHVRRAHHGDFEHILAIAKRAYPEANIPEQLAREVFWALVDHEYPLLTVHAHGFLMIDVVHEWWANGKPEVHTVFMASDPDYPTSMAGYWLLQNVIGWSREKGAPVIFGAATGVDLTPYARRLGAIQEPPSFRLETVGEQENPEAADQRRRHGSR